MSKPPSLPWLYLLLDVVGALLIVTGVLALTGVDFGHSVLRTVAVPFIVIGALLMLPLVGWAITRGRGGPK
ncbi:MAG: hypothetical protein HKN58_09560 [Xanthomonadales bacterium]|nr:hypothetical protein [Xanthomonadales bacterium]